MVTLWWMEWCRHWRRSPAPFGWSHWTPPIMAHLSPTLWRAATTLSFSSTTMGQWNTKSIISYSTRLCSGTSCLFSGINILWAFFLLLVGSTDGSSMWMVRSGSLTVLLWTRVYGTTLGCPGGVGMETGESTSMGSPQTEAKACQSAPLSQV